ncbi:MAG: beta-N-acetylglucosaminidase domain-containing protein, partial [Candidatus Limnocylindria bacterium]
EGMDLEILLERLRGAVAMGADRILLLADDIPASLGREEAGRFGRLEDAHAWLVERVLHALDGAVSLAFCPTDYAGPGSPYLERLGAVLPFEVDICWTGPDVCVPRITADQVNAIGDVLRRPPLIWDNYPVNDDGMVDQLHIGPIRGRDAMLDRWTRGILVNAALQHEAGLIPLAAWAEYLRAPAAYDPDAAFVRAVEWVAGDAEDARAVATIAAAYDRSVIPQGWSHPAPQVVAAAIARLPRLRNRALAEDLAPFVVARA